MVICFASLVVTHAKYTLSLTVEPVHLVQVSEGKNHLHSNGPEHIKKYVNWTESYLLPISIQARCTNSTGICHFLEPLIPKLMQYYAQVFYRCVHYNKHRKTSMFSVLATMMTFKTMFFYSI